MYGCSEMRIPSIIIRYDTLNENDTPFFIEFHWHMELLSEVIMVYSACTVEPPNNRQLGDAILVDQ